MGRLGGFRYREIVARLQRAGFRFDRQGAGSHEIWFNPATSRQVAVSRHAGDMPEGTLRAILRTADITPEYFLRLGDRKDDGVREGEVMATLMLSDVEPALVAALYHRAKVIGRSPEQVHRAILNKALLPQAAPGSFARMLASMPNVGRDEDFRRC
jgi:predicted RNA binding protein YcfA (HicA-like mRNA interferase family)/plasmid stability protein